MPDTWAVWDEQVKKTGRPARVAEELNDLELLILLADDKHHRPMEKQILRQEAYRRMGHPEAPPPGKATQGEPGRETYSPEAFSRLPTRGDVRDPF